MSRYREALLICLKWVEAQPLNDEAWFYRAFCEVHGNQPAQALVSIERAEVIKPGSEKILALKAQILGSLSRTEECLHILEGLLKRPDLSSGIQQSVGTTLSNVGKHEQAAGVLECVRNAEPQNVENLTTLASTLHILGRSEEAAELHKEAIRLQPENFRAYWLLGQMQQATDEQNYIDMFSESLAKNPGKLQARICLNFGLAKQFEDVGRYDEAFESLQRGSAGVLEHTPYPEDQDERMQTMIARSWDDNFFATNKKGYNSDEVIFIVGMPRTGTTLLEQIITTYDGIDTAGELHHFSRLLNEACHKISPAGGVDDLYEPADRVDFERLGRDYIDSARQLAPDSPRFIDKYPLNFLMLGAIMTALPGAKIINLQRNPMDTCFSNYKLLFRLGTALHSYDLLTLGAYYRRYKELMRHWHAQAPGRILDVQYERLVTEPEQETRRVSDFLDLSWRPECLEFYKSGAAVATASVTQVRNPINTGSLHKWKKYERYLEPLKAYFREHGIDPEGH